MLKTDKELKDCDANGTLLNKTRELLQNDQRTLLEIHSLSGIPFYWLQKLPV